MIDARPAPPSRQATTGPGADLEPTDAELLSRFVERNEQAAFERLVRRHSKMVMGVCRRVLGHEQAAEDAFQATFMVLLRKAKSIGRPERLSNWLYGVAFRVARRGRIKASRERASEGIAETEASSDPHSDPEWLEAKSALDEELSQLPEKYRLALVTCYLDGKTNVEAARLLGCPDGSIGDRLSRARAELRARLLRRGMVLSAGFVALLLEQGQASAGVSEELIRKALDAAADFVGGAYAQGALAELPEAPGAGAGPIAPADKDATGESVSTPANDEAVSRKKRRSRKMVNALFWLSLAFLFVIPLYELSGSPLGRAWRGHLLARGVELGVIPRASASAFDNPRADAELFGKGDADSSALASDSSPSADDDERCKRCLGTNCGTEPAEPDRTRSRQSFWNWFFSRP